MLLSPVIPLSSAISLRLDEKRSAIQLSSELLSHVIGLDEKRSAILHVQRVHLQLYESR